MLNLTLWSQKQDATDLISLDVCFLQASLFDSFMTLQSDASQLKYLWYVETERSNNRLLKFLGFFFSGMHYVILLKVRNKTSAVHFPII